MPLTLTIDIFSGRPNPVLELSDSAAKKLVSQLSFSNLKRKTEKTIPFPSVLGFRGFILEQKGRAFSKDLPAWLHITHETVYSPTHWAKSNDLSLLQSFVSDNLRSFKGLEGIKGFREGFNKQFGDFMDICPPWRKRYKELLPGLLDDYIRIPKFPSPCYCAPVPDLEAWNTDSNIQNRNNCYNYASNYRSDTYGQPGQAAGSKWNDLSACSVPAGNISAKAGAIADGLIDIPANNNKCVSPGHTVALVVSPGWDYHWYRKGRNGNWSHKMGGTPATILDNSGNPITDPRTANRGSYTDFCTFMQVIHGHFKIEGIWD